MFSHLVFQTVTSLGNFKLTPTEVKQLLEVLMRTGWWFCTMFHAKECFGVCVCMHYYCSWVIFYYSVYMFFSFESLPTSPLLCGWYWYCGIVCGGSFFSMTQVVWWRSNNSTCLISNAMRLQTTKLPMFKMFQNIFQMEMGVSQHLISFKSCFLLSFLGQHLHIKPPDGLPILNLGMLIKG